MLLLVSPGQLKVGRDPTDPAAAGNQPTHFQRNSVGRGQLAVFLRRSLGRYDADSGASLAS